MMMISVTRLGDLLEFGQIFKSIWQQLICPNLPHSYAISVKMSKSIIFLVKSFWATFIDIWQFFSGHTDADGFTFFRCTFEIRGR